jgi:hypothetical protein
VAESDNMVSLGGNPVKVELDYRDTVLERCAELPPGTPHRAGKVTFLSLPNSLLGH